MATRGIVAGLAKTLLLGSACTAAFAAIPVLKSIAGQRDVSFTADFVVELENEYVYSASDPQAELNDAFATVESELALTLGAASLHALLTLEPVLDPADDRIFEDFGLYFEELYLALEIGPGRLRAGKINPVFDLANDAAPGIYGDELAGDYELTERIGLALELPFRAFGGKHLATATAFMADRSPLSNSFLTRRGELRRDDGGVSNTGYPTSLAFSLGGDFGETGYNLGLRHQEAGRGDVAHEFGGVLGLIQGFDIGPVDAALFGEIGYFPDFGGGREHTAFYTIGTEAELGDASVSAIYSLRDLEGSPADHVVGFSLGYELSEGLSAEAGYRYLREEGETSHTLGFLLTYEFSLL